ncbi:hypothetical protein DYB25_006614 [Aphanomyces astaci]|uniref:GAF domain-containing protein n=2 Tax=Aphanomyces astaci TaxID=112090 RepID=A0A397CBI3_APHAT|nr:hypothetical protein DYB36_012876 [Aphanomyces astaci]RHY22036.1 hypothetical protein DYB25_006614 [Aphanomyces astaci]RHY39363.1 hypothetical protein DYB30_013765 [Aphanomyces astaci]RHY85849.1 hypothetical protein DYB26_011468 [Aphanomyces astaci]
MTRGRSESKKRRLAKACASCMRRFNAFHWKYKCTTCNRVVCRDCTIKATWIKRVCWKCVLDAQTRSQNDLHCSGDLLIATTVPMLDLAEESTACLPVPQPHDNHHPNNKGQLTPLTPRTTQDSEDHSVYCYTDTLRGSRYPSETSSVDSFLEDGGLRVSAKYTDDLVQYSTKLSSRPTDSLDLDFDWVHPFPKAPRPPNEGSRLDCVRRLDIDTHLPTLLHDPVLANHVADAMRVLDNAPIGSLHLVAEDVVYNVACTGYSRVFKMTNTTVREEAACTYGLLQPIPMVVLDTSNDPRLRAHPLAVEHRAGAYVSVPVMVSSSLHKECIGTIDVACHEPLQEAPSAAQLKALQTLATGVGMYIERRCAELNQVHPSNRGRRRHTSPIATIEEDTVPMTCGGMSKESVTQLHELWARVTQTSLYMRASVSR